MSVEEFDYYGALRITSCYTQPGHDGTVHLFVTADSAALADSATLGWDAFHQGPIDLHTVGGDHLSVLDESHAADVARVVRSSIMAAQGADSPTAG